MNGYNYDYNYDNHHSHHLIVINNCHHHLNMSHATSAHQNSSSRSISSITITQQYPDDNDELGTQDASAPRVPRCFYLITRWPRRNRARDSFASRVLGMFFYAFSFLLLINNPHLDYFYGSHEMTMTMNGHHCHDTNKGQGRAWDTSWSVLSLKYVFFFLSFFIYYTNDYLKAAKPMNDNDMCSRGGNWEKGSLRYVIYIYIKFFIILY